MENYINDAECTTCSGVITRKGTLRIKPVVSLKNRVLLATYLVLQILVLLACFFPAGKALLSVPVQEEAKTTEHRPDAPYQYALRVAIPKVISPSSLSPYGPGFEQELVQSFCKKYQYSLEWINADSRETALGMLQKGEVNLVVGFGGELPAEFKAAVIDGPPYAQFKPIRVYGSTAPDEDEVLKTDKIDSMASLEDANKAEGTDSQDPNKGSDLNANGLRTFKPFSMAADISGNMLGKNAQGLLLDPASYALWLPLDTRMRTGKTLNKTVAYHWFWGSSDRILDNSLKEFWNLSETSAKISEMTERYYGFLPKTPQKEDLLSLAGVIDENLVKYNAFLLKASEETGIDPLLIAAVVFQESRFDPQARSSTGVRGIMQLTQGTAEMLNIDRLDPEECIVGGARYLRSLWNDLEDMNLDPWDRWCFSLAAFNQGPGNLRRVLRQFDKDNVPTWADLKKVYPSFSKQVQISGENDINMSTTITGFRGKEAVAFVENVRYYYYVLSGLAWVAQPERQDLTALLELLPAS